MASEPSLRFVKLNEKSKKVLIQDKVSQQFYEKYPGLPPLNTIYNYIGDIEEKDLLEHQTK